MSTDAATPETPVPPDPDEGGDGSVGDGSPSDRTAAGTTPDETTPPGTTSDEAEPEAAAEPAVPDVEEAEPAEDAADAAAEDAVEDAPVAEDAVGTDAAAEAAESPGPDIASYVPAQAAPVHETTREPAPGPVADDAGGRLTARLREARARLQPEQTTIPAPRTPEGVVPPVPFGQGAGTPPADLLQEVDVLAAQLAELEDEAEDPARLALLRALDRSAAGIPDGGWSRADRIDAESLADAVELADVLHAATASLLERLDAEERTGAAVEVDAVATALQVARVVLDLEAFARHGR